MDELEKDEYFCEDCYDCFFVTNEEWVKHVKKHQREKLAKMAQEMKDVNRK